MIGPVSEFEVAAQSIGLEWLFGEEAVDSTDDDVEEDDEPRDEYASKWLYLTMPTLAGLKKLLKQWELYQEGKSPAPEYKELWRLFGYLKDLRGWSAKDRIDSTVIRYIERALSKDPSRSVVIELDLWYRTESQRRDGALRSVADTVQAVGGQMLDSVDIPEIRYQGVLARVPAHVARDIAAGVDGQGIANLDEIMTIRPQSAYSSHIGPADAPEMPTIPAVTLGDQKRIVALLDGYPIQNHAALTGRVSVHEFEVTAANAPVSARHHGTGMASLILHGDLHAPVSLDNHHLVSIPVLTGSPGQAETTPAEKLPIAVIYRTLKKMLASSDDELKNIVIVNHSICDIYAPFIRRPSAWAALLDYFSHHHRLLFVVSAGNVFESMQVADFADHADFMAAQDAVREASILNALEQNRSMRTMLSPAESVNSITVGALHQDDAPAHTGAIVDPFPTVLMTNLASGLGLGVNKSIKPDLIESGGRFAAGCSNISGGGVDIHAAASAEFGHLVAAPSATGNLRQVARMAGTSNSAALTTRSALRIADAIEQTFKADRIDWHTLKTRVPLLKALLIHTCRWGKVGQILEDSFPPADKSGWSKRRKSISQFLGYGRVDSKRAISGDHNRITLLAEDVINPEDRHQYEIPLPPSMLGKRELRCVTLTLAWTTPVVLSASDCRGVGLRVVDVNGKGDFWKGVRRILQPNIANSERGTTVHLILEGKSLVNASSGNSITLCVQAIAKHANYNKTPVPYALAVSLEMAQTLRSQLYEEVRALIQARTRTRVQR